MKPRIVIYHRADFDGIFSREIARKFLGDTADYIGWDYGDPVPEIPLETERLYMIDISIRELMGHPELIWIDHHKTAIAEFSKHIQGYQIDGVAACRLAWQWFTDPLGVPPLTLADFVERRVEEPLAVRLAGEYDIWDKRDPRADLFQSGLRSQEIDWPRLLAHFGEDYVGEILEAGTYVQHAAREGQAYLMREHSFDLRFEGLLFLAINAAVRNSAAFESKVRPDHDGCLSFVWVANKGRWKISLRGVPHKPAFDLSAIAIKHGGGGHKQACGFECVVLPFGDFARERQLRLEAEARVERLAPVLRDLLFAFENADETGYVTDAGFVDLDSLKEKARAALAAPGDDAAMTGGAL